MRISDADNHGIELHEVYVTINISELYAEIVEVYRESQNGPGFLLITSVKANESKPRNQQDINSEFRRLEL
jgi:hypothetical protein